MLLLSQGNAVWAELARNSDLFCGGRERAGNEYSVTLRVEDTAGEAHFSPVAFRVLRQDLHNWGREIRKETDKNIRRELKGYIF